MLTTKIVGLALLWGLLATVFLLWLFWQMLPIFALGVLLLLYFVMISGLDTGRTARD